MYLELDYFYFSSLDLKVKAYCSSLERNMLRGKRQITQF